MKKKKKQNFSSTPEVLCAALFRRARCSQPSKSLMRFIADLSDACGLADKTSVNILQERKKKTTILNVPFQSYLLLGILMFNKTWLKSNRGLFVNSSNTIYHNHEPLTDLNYFLKLF